MESAAQRNEVTDTVLGIVPIDLKEVGLQEGFLKGEVAVVTGSASNVGLGYARAIAAAGGRVVVTDINEAAGKEAERVINSENGAGCALFVKCDVTLESDVKNLAEQAFKKFGKVDILINNAMNKALNGAV
ncbi:MAG: SDR family NAD(P)-dependent oxidoreductase, partial [Clostridiales bacterium]|nr:SDR family NAD(P)-dependent oxidoreductase [Clostridiales bacterium]